MRIADALRSAVALAALATPALAADKVAPLPPYAAAYQPTGVDERGVWLMADEQERRLRDAADVIRDSALNGYIRQVLCRTVGDDRCKGVRIYIMRIPAFNATMSPNGMLILWSGALLRLHSEAELAAVLGHEFGHFELRHTVAGFQQRRGASDLMAWSSILVANNTLLQMSLIGGMFAFSRDQEKAADMFGLRFMASAHYGPAAAPTIWEHVMAEDDATTIGRHRTPNQKYSAGFFATHPTNLTRATYLRTAVATMPPGDPAAPDGYRAAIAPWLPMLLADQVKRNDFGGSEYLLGQLATDGWTTPLLFARGELYRLRGHPRDLVSAADFYQQAIAHGDAPAEAYRGLGLSLLRSQQVEPARVALSEYLRRKPAADDAALISTLIAS